ATDRAVVVEPEQGAATAAESGPEAEVRAASGAEVVGTPQALDLGMAARQQLADRLVRAVVDHDDGDAFLADDVRDAPERVGGVLPVHDHGDRPRARGAAHPRTSS